MAFRLMFRSGKRLTTAVRAEDNFFAKKVPRASRADSGRAGRHLFDELSHEAELNFQRTRFRKTN